MPTTTARRHSIAALVTCAVGLAPLAVSAPDPHDPRDARAAQVLNGLRPPVAIEGEDVRYSLSERMAHYGVPGVSIAVVDGGKIVWAEGFGVKALGEPAAVDTNTMFQAASISKPVAAIGVMKLVEEGKLDLDADVNSKLKTWKVPESEFTADEKVTLRRLLSHSAGTTVHGFGGFPSGTPTPTLVQILDGVPPAKNDPVRVNKKPGEGFRYSGGGIAIEELLVGDVIGENPSEYQNKTVLAPLNMMSSTFTQPLPNRFAAQAAAGHKPSATAPIPGHWNSHPMSYAAGLWTTPSDLCRVIMAMQTAAGGSQCGPVSPGIAKAMLTPTAPPMGLGFVVSGAGEDLRFRHSGANDGYRAVLEATARTGKGLVVMTNSESGALLAQEIMRGIKHAFSWTDTDQQIVKAVALDAAARARVVGTYALPEPPGAKVIVSEKNGELRMRIEGTPNPLEMRLAPKSPSEFLALEAGYEVRAELQDSGPAVALIRGKIRAPRVESP